MQRATTLHHAQDHATQVANFDNNLSSADDTVQKALETLDELVASGGGITLISPDDDTYRITNNATGAWAGTINGAPSGASVGYTGATGTELSLKPFASGQDAKLRLYNTTRGDYALIEDVDTGTNVITLTATAPAAWANGDSITVASDTVSGGGYNWIDLELSEGDAVDSDALWMYFSYYAATGGGNQINFHPYESYSLSKNTGLLNQVGGIAYQGTIPVKLTSNVFSMSWEVSGTTTWIIRIKGYW